MLLITPDNQYPRFIGDLKLEYPDYQEGDSLPEGWKVVEPVEWPELAEDERIVELFPVEEDGKYYQNFTKRKVTQEELDAIKLSEIRHKVSRGEYITEEEAALLVK
jgi:hypothetical protein